MACERAPRSKALAALAAALLIGTQGCVAPTNLVSGIELSWVAVEVGAADDDAPRSRTCDGAFMESVAVTVTDLGDPERARTFNYRCEYGYQSADDFVAKVSDIFVDLEPGRYAVDLRALGPRGITVFEDAREVRVKSQRARLVRVDMTLDTVGLELELSGLDACGNLGGTLRYRDPATDLAEDELPDDLDDLDDADGAGAPEIRYRAALTSDRGLRLDGTSRPCADVGAGVHRFDDLDPGRYELVLNGLGPRDCVVPVTLEPVPVDPDDATPDVRISLDLANPPC